MKRILLAIGLANLALTARAPGLQQGHLPERAGSVRIWTGSPGSLGSLLACSPVDGSDLGTAFAVADLTFLPLDYVGRVDALRDAPDRPRFLDDLPSGTRLALPASQGMLYHYARRASASRVHYGFLWVRPDGRSQLLAERRGTGSGGSQDPYVERISVAPDGRAILVATQPQSMGDLLEVRLGDGQIQNRTAGIPPLQFLNAGLWLHAGWGFGVASSGLYRFERTGAAQAELVTLSNGVTASYFSGEANVSLSRDWGIFTAGEGPQALHAFVFGRSGSARRAHAVPAALSSAGFLPESLAGPFLAVSDDGEHCAWRIETPTSRECFLARSTLQVEGGSQISADQYYLDTLDEIGQMIFFDPSKLSLVVGASNPGGGPENADLFQASLDASFNPSFQNLTLSSGDAAVPFQSPGTIEFCLSRRMPRASGYFLFDGNNERVLVVRDNQPTPSVLLDDVKDVYFVETSGDWVAFAARRAQDPRPREIYRIDAALQGPATLLVPGQDNYDYSRAWASADGWLGYKLLIADTVESMRRVHIASGVAQSFSSSATVFGDTLGFAASGAMLVREGGDFGPAKFWLWPTSGAPVQCVTPKPSGFFVPGG